MVATVDPATPVIFLDTGKLFAETHAYREELVDLLRLADVRVVRPRAAAVARHDPGGELWRREPDLCCHIRKTEPLQEALAGFAAWITGRKRFQAGLRSRLPIIEPGGRAGGSSSIRWRSGPPRTSSSTGCCAICPASAGRPGLPVDRLRHLHGR